MPQLTDPPPSPALANQHPLLDCLLAAPETTLLAWISDYFQHKPDTILSGVYIVSGREFYSGDALSYATVLTAKGYQEQDRNGKDRVGTCAYDTLDIHGLFEVCYRLYQESQIDAGR